MRIASIVNRIRSARADLVGQVALVLVAWGYLWALHASNDGLWYQGDAPRHAANGLFWMEFFRSPSLDPQDFALRYYARYPVICPTVYPPGFYLLEAAAFGLFGPSPYLAKGMVLLFTLLASLYLTAWLRRWVGPEAGWAGALLPLLPGLVRWSHVIMLNVPAFALMLAALYHVRRWLEEEDAPAARHLYFAAALSVLAVLTHLTAGVVVLLILAWLFTLGRWRRLFAPRTLLVALLCGLLLVPWIVINFRWTPQQLTWVADSGRQNAKLENWLYYAVRLTRLVEPEVLGLAAVGAVIGLLRSSTRKETARLLLSLALIYAFFSGISLKEDRYALLLIFPLLCLAAAAVLGLAQGVETLAGGRRLPRSHVPAVFVALLAVLAWHAPSVSMVALEGIKEAADFLATVAPDEPILYDGCHDGAFTFYVQASDPDYRRQVVLGSKLVYASVMYPQNCLQEYAATPEEILDILRQQGGCCWFAIERGELSESITPARNLRWTLERPEFELVRTFPANGMGIDCIEVYRMLGPVARPDEADVPFPAFGKDRRYRTKPIERSGGQSR